MKSNLNGFTLIELMIVVAIIAILAAIAISQYQDYVIRSQVSEGSNLADGVKTAVSDFYNSHGRFPSNNTSSFVSQISSIRGNYVTAVTVNPGTPGVITASFGGNKASSQLSSGMTISFSPLTHAGSIEWHCISTTLKARWCSTSCNCSG